MSPKEWDVSARKVSHKSSKAAHPFHVPHKRAGTKGIKHPDEDWPQELRRRDRGPKSGEEAQVCASTPAEISRTGSLAQTVGLPQNKEMLMFLVTRIVTPTQAFSCSFSCYMDVWSWVGWGNNVYVYFHTDGMPLYNSVIIAFMFTCTQIGCHYTKALMFTCTQIGCRFTIALMWCLLAHRRDATLKDLLLHLHTNGMLR